MSPAEARIIREPLTRSELRRLAEARFGDMVKAVVDIDRRIMALSGELHSDEEVDDPGIRESIRRVVDMLVVDA